MDIAAVRVEVAEVGARTASVKAETADMEAEVVSLRSKNANSTIILPNPRVENVGAPRGVSTSACPDIWEHVPVDMLEIRTR